MILFLVLKMASHSPKLTKVLSLKLQRFSLSTMSIFFTPSGGFPSQSINQGFLRGGEAVFTVKSPRTKHSEQWAGAQLPAGKVMSL